MEVGAIIGDLSLHIVWHAEENQNQTHGVKKVKELVGASDKPHLSALLRVLSDSLLLIVTSIQVGLFF